MPTGSKTTTDEQKIESLKTLNQQAKTLIAENDQIFRDDAQYTIDDVIALIGHNSSAEFRKQKKALLVAYIDVCDTVESKEEKTELIQKKKELVTLFQEVANACSNANSPSKRNSGDTPHQFDFFGLFKQLVTETIPNLTALTPQTPTARPPAPPSVDQRTEDVVGEQQLQDTINAAATSINAGLAQNPEITVAELWSLYQDAQSALEDAEQKQKKAGIASDLDRNLFDKSMDALKAKLSTKSSDEVDGFVSIKKDEFIEVMNSVAVAQPGAGQAAVIDTASFELNLKSFDLLCDFLAASMSAELKKEVADAHTSAQQILVGSRSTAGGTAVEPQMLVDNHERGTEPEDAQDDDIVAIAKDIDSVEVKRLLEDVRQCQDALARAQAITYEQEADATAVQGVAVDGAADAGESTAEQKEGDDTVVSSAKSAGVEGAADIGKSTAEQKEGDDTVAESTGTAGVDAVAVAEQALASAKDSLKAELSKYYSVKLRKASELLTYLTDVYIPNIDDSHYRLGVAKFAEAKLGVLKTQCDEKIGSEEIAVQELQTALDAEKELAKLTELRDKQTALNSKLQRFCAERARRARQSSAVAQAPVGTPIVANGEYQSLQGQEPNLRRELASLEESIAQATANEASQQKLIAACKDNFQVSSDNPNAPTIQEALRRKKGVGSDLAAAKEDLASITTAIEKITTIKDGLESGVAGDCSYLTQCAIKHATAAVASDNHREITDLVDKALIFSDVQSASNEMTIMEKQISALHGLFPTDDGESLQSPQNIGDAKSVSTELDLFLLPYKKALMSPVVCDFKNILLVDDSLARAEALRDLLNVAGYEAAVKTDDEGSFERYQDWLVSAGGCRATLLMLALRTEFEIHLFDAVKLEQTLSLSQGSEQMKSVYGSTFDTYAEAIQKISAIEATASQTMRNLAAGDLASVGTNLEVLRDCGQFTEETNYLAAAMPSHENDWARLDTLINRLESKSSRLNEYSNGQLRDCVDVSTTSGDGAPSVTVKSSPIGSFKTLVSCMDVIACLCQPTGANRYVEKDAMDMIQEHNAAAESLATAYESGEDEQQLRQQLVEFTYARARLTIAESILKGINARSEAQQASLEFVQKVIIANDSDENASGEQYSVHDELARALGGEQQGIVGNGVIVELIERLHKDSISNNPRLKSQAEAQLAGAISTMAERLAIVMQKLYAHNRKKQIIPDSGSILSVVDSSDFKSVFTECDDVRSALEYVLTPLNVDTPSNYKRLVELGSASIGNFLKTLHSINLLASIENVSIEDRLSNLCHLFTYLNTAEEFYLENVLSKISDESELASSGAPKEPLGEDVASKVVTKESLSSCETHLLAALSDRERTKSNLAEITSTDVVMEDSPEFKQILISMLTELRSSNSAALYFDAGMVRDYIVNAPKISSNENVQLNHMVYLFSEMERAFFQRKHVIGWGDEMKSDMVKLLSFELDGDVVKLLHKLLTSKKPDGSMRLVRARGHGGFAASVLSTRLLNHYEHEGNDVLTEEVRSALTSSNHCPSDVLEELENLRTFIFPQQEYIEALQDYFDNIGRWTAQLNIDIDAARLVVDSESSNSQGYPLSDAEESLSEPESEAAEEGAAAEGAKSESGLGASDVQGTLEAGPEAKAIAAEGAKSESGLGASDVQGTREVGSEAKDAVAVESTEVPATLEAGPEAKAIAAEGAKSESGLGGHTVPAPGSPLADTGLFSVAVNSPFQPAQLGAANPLSSPGSSSI